MSKPFAFGFDDDDIESGEAEVAVPNQKPVTTQGEPQEIVKPRLHTLYDLLSSLPSQISYSTSAIDYEKDTILKIPRRELFDIRTQIMAEDETPSMKPSYGVTNDDITPKIYEGGFKTWECSIDLANYLAKQLKPLAGGEGLPKGRLHIVELGAGSALPSLVVLSALLSRPKVEHHLSPAVYLTVCDYNISVLTHSTIPNLFLVWCACSSLLSDNMEDDFEITPELTDRFMCDLADRNIRIDAVSGAWGPEFLGLVPQAQSDERNHATTLVLASETIYALSTLVPFTETLVAILRAAEKNGGEASGMVAVKQVYFGVGGGVEDFSRVLNKIGGQSELLWELEGVGVGRVILGVRIRLGQALSALQ